MDNVTTSPHIATAATKRSAEPEGNDKNDSQPPQAKRIKMERRECSICGEDTALNQFPLHPHKGVKHSREACMDCWRSHTAAEVESKAWDAVACLQCAGVLSQEEYRACARADCDWACFFHTKEDGNIFTCHKCGYRHCVVCEVAFHEDQTCGQYQEATRQAREERERENKASEEMVGKISKVCPQCGRLLDKWTGCDHVTCTMCKHEFCWRCFVPYAGENGIRRVGNAAHKRDCRHHA